VRSGGTYSIPSWAERADESPFRRALPLIRSIRLAGPYQMLMLTMEGAGQAVAAAIDASDWEDLVGTVAGYSSVLLLTEHKFYQDLLAIVKTTMIYTHVLNRGGRGVQSPIDVL
jgi:arginine repressor